MHVAIKILQDAVIVQQIFRVIGRFLKVSWLYLAEKVYRVVTNTFPQLGVKFSIESESLGVPAPPNIIS